MIAMVALTIINLIVLALNLPTPSQAMVAGMNETALVMDRDFERAVLRVVEKFCSRMPASCTASIDQRKPGNFHCYGQVSPLRTPGNGPANPARFAKQQLWKGTGGGDRACPQAAVTSEVLTPPRSTGSPQGRVFGGLRSLVDLWSKTREARQNQSKSLILLALPRGIEPLFQP
jgi:hypothetical protein